MVNAFVNSVLFRPPQCERYEFPSEVIRLRTSRGNTISAIYLRRSPKTNVTVLYSHENGEDLNTAYRRLRKLSSWLKVNVVAYDYSGYGESTGTKIRAQHADALGDEKFGISTLSPSVVFSVQENQAKPTAMPISRQFMNT